jgi:hypothetical protein
MLEPRTLAVISICLTSSLSLLALSAEPPSVSVAEACAMEDGAKVRTMGVLTRSWVYESGYEALLLADCEQGDTVRVMCSRGREDMPSQWAAVGDAILVEGRVSRDASETLIFSSSDRVDLVQKAEFVMNVDILSIHWRLFEHDRFNISGVAVPGAADGEWLLGDDDGSCVISVRMDDPCEALRPGDRLTLDCTLLVDTETMMIFLRVWAAELRQ